MADNVGIYKIKSPSGKVYIGQSWNICKRYGRYKSGGSKKQPKLFSSINKYGWNNHICETIHELPVDVSQVTLDIYECFYIEVYKRCYELMNVKDGGSSGKHSEETKARMRANPNCGVFKKGTATALGRIPSIEVRLKMSESAKKRGNNLPIGFTHSKETIEKISKLNKGKPSHNKGKKLSKEWKDRMSKAKLGKTGSLCPNSKKIICTISGKEFNSIGEAASSIGIKRTTLNSYLSGQNNNKTTLKYQK